MNNRDLNVVVDVSSIVNIIRNLDIRLTADKEAIVKIILDSFQRLEHNLKYSLALEIQKLSKQTKIKKKKGKKRGKKKL